MKRIAVGIILTTLLLAGCGDGAAREQEVTGVDRFCQLVEQYNKGNGFVAPPEDTPESEREAALTAALRDYLALPEVQAILNELGEVAPPEVDEAVTVMRDTANTLIETGENGFTEPEAVAANDQIKAYTESACAPKPGAGAGAEGDAEAGDEAGESQG